MGEDFMQYPSGNRSQGGHIWLVGKSELLISLYIMWGPGSTNSKSPKQYLVSNGSFFLMIFFHFGDFFFKTVKKKERKKERNLFFEVLFLSFFGKKKKEIHRI